MGSHPPDCLCCSCKADKERRSTFTRNEAKKRWEKLIKEEAQRVADRENEISGFCGPYGWDEASDHIDAVRKEFEEIGEAYLALKKESEAQHGKTS